MNETLAARAPARPIPGREDGETFFAAQGAPPPLGRAASVTSRRSIQPAGVTAMPVR